jgi:DNA-binding MarR family transcriptional regulator
MPDDRCIFKEGRYPVYMSPEAALDAAGQSAWLSLLQARSTVLDAVEEDLERAGSIPLAWVEVLLQVVNGPGGRLRMQDIAHYVLLSKSGVTRLIDRMVDAGMISRESHEKDRRVVYAGATAKGREALRAALPVFSESLNRHFVEVLTKAELRMLGATLAKVVDAAGVPPTACPTSIPPEPAVAGRMARSRVRR